MAWQPAQDLRRLNRDILLNTIMREIDDLLSDDQRRQIEIRLCEFLDANGAHILTDADRNTLGLEPRDSLGWTATQRMQARAQHNKAMSALTQGFAFKSKS